MNIPCVLILVYVRKAVREGDRRLEGLGQREVEVDMNAAASTPVNTEYSCLRSESASARLDAISSDPQEGPEAKAKDAERCDTAVILSLPAPLWRAETRAAIRIGGVRTNTRLRPTRSRTAGVLSIPRIAGLSLAALQQEKLC